MLNVNTETYKNAVAEAIIKARDNLKDHNDTIKDHDTMIDGLDVVTEGHTDELDNHADALTNHGIRVTTLEVGAGTTPAISADNDANVWFFVIGTDKKCWYKKGDGGYNWKLMYVGPFQGGVTAVHHTGSGNIRIALRGAEGGLYQGRIAAATEGIAALENEHGDIL